MAKMVIVMRYWESTSEKGLQPDQVPERGYDYGKISKETSSIEIFWA